MAPEVPGPGKKKSDGDAHRGVFVLLFVSMKATFNVTNIQIDGG